MQFPMHSKLLSKNIRVRRSSDAIWYEIWNNSRAAMHSVMVYTDEQIFGYRFLVYFEEKDLGFPMECFLSTMVVGLDRP